MTPNDSFKRTPKMRFLRPPTPHHVSPRRGRLRVRIGVIRAAAIAFALVAGGCVSFTDVATRDRGEAALAALCRAEPSNLVWRHSQRIDINCDRIDDDVFVAQDEHRYYVGVVLGARTEVPGRYSIVAFSLSGDWQESLCGPVEGLTPESMNTCTADATGEEELGYVVDRSCNGLRLTSGECDSFHIYWNRMSDALDWWRL